MSEELSQGLHRMARFRNMLVFVYWELDYGLVYEVLQEHLDDVGAFVGTIGAQLLTRARNTGGAATLRTRRRTILPTSRPAGARGGRCPCVGDCA